MMKMIYRVINLFPSEANGAPLFLHKHRFLQIFTLLKLNILIIIMNYCDSPIEIICSSECSSVLSVVNPLLVNVLITTPLIVRRMLVTYVNNSALSAPPTAWMNHCTENLNYYRGKDVKETFI